MKPLPKSAVSKLNLSAALDTELASTRNLLPPEPWLSAIEKQKSQVTRWVSSTLESGGVLAPSCVVNARKATGGIRPVPVVGVAERVIYRALTDYITRDLEISERTPEDYREMLSGPIKATWQDKSKFRLTDFKFKYVVESDIASFYQYIDHSILAQELQIQTGEVEHSHILSDVLAELEGRSFGVPQLLDPSDKLSEVYISILERDLIRQGMAVWRYNDDFRIGVATYADALHAVEALARSARSIGLTVNESKTKTPSMMTYLFSHTNLEIDDREVDIDPKDVELIISEYIVEDDTEQIDRALATIARINSGNEDRIDLKNVNPADLRELRRAINALNRHDHDGALGEASQLFLFCPSLTPRISQYLITMSEGSHRARVSEILDHLLLSDSTSDWQRIWLLYVGRESLHFLFNDKGTDWVRVQEQRGRGGLLAAEATLTLSAVSETTAEALDRAIRMEPAALTPWYVIAMKNLYGHSQSSDDQKLLRALKGTHPLYRILLEDQPTENGKQ